ncbi:MAG: translation elongation factor Ts [Saprospiraceae bacterium]
MYEISAADVKKLREMTGAGMMDCKSALTEAEGNFEKAIEVLRKKGQKLSVKRADRDAKEGVVIASVSPDKTKGVVIRLSSETDFVSKNEDFINTAKQIAQIALDHFPEDLEALGNLPINGVAIKDKVTDMVAAIGEKIGLESYEKLEAPQIVSYIHMGNRAGVIVGLNKADDAFTDAGKDVAMQIAAMKPIAVNADGVDKSVIEKEIEIGKEVARQEGKPEEMLEKIAMGKLNKFYKDNTLLLQEFVKDSKLNVDQYLKKFDKDLTVIAFKHVMNG